MPVDEKIDGSMTFRDVGGKRLGEIIAGFNKIGSYSLWVKVLGAMRTGEKIDSRGEYRELLDRKVTARKQFFLIKWEEGREVLVRPFEDRFQEVQVRLEE